MVSHPIGTYPVGLKVVTKLRSEETLEMTLGHDKSPAQVHASQTWPINMGREKAEKWKLNKP